MMHADLRDEYLARVVRGKTFCDVGGLWGTLYEKVSVARDLGATELTMLDAARPNHELWSKFHDRMSSLGIERCNCITADISIVRGIAFDVVHCSGVLYHHPNPLSVLAALKSVTREHLVLTSVVTPERVENERGLFVLPSSAAVFVPALSKIDRAILAAHWKARGVEACGLTQPGEYRPNDFGPWWWLFTVPALRAMCECAGFRIRDADYTWDSKAYTLLLAA